METLMSRIFSYLLVVVSLIFSLPQDAIAQQDYQTIYDIEWHPNEDILAVATDIGIILYDANLEEIGHFNRGGIGIEWSPNGEFLAAIGGYLNIFDVETQEQIIAVNRQSNSYEADWHPTENIIAIADNNIIQLWDSEMGSILASTEIDRFPIMSLSWHHDGVFLAASSEYNDVAYVLDTSTGEMQHLLLHSQGIEQVVWETDSSQLAVIGGTTIQIWDLSDSQTTRLLLEHDARVLSADWNINGILASATQAGDLYIWNIEKGESFHLIQQGEFINHVKWSYDGQYLAYSTFSRAEGRKIIQILSLAELSEVKR